MNKKKALMLLDAIKKDYIANGDPEYDEIDHEFITVYFNLGRKKDLRWCNGFDDAIDEVRKLTDEHKIAIQIERLELFKE